MVWPFDLKKSKKDCLISALVILFFTNPAKHQSVNSPKAHPLNLTKYAIKERKIVGVPDESLWES